MSGALKPTMAAFGICNGLCSMRYPNLVDQKDCAWGCGMPCNQTCSSVCSSDDLPCLTGCGNRNCPTATEGFRGHKQSISTGAKVGIGIGAVILLILIYWMLIRHR